MTLIREKSNQLFCQDPRFALKPPCLFRIRLSALSAVRFAFPITGDVQNLLSNSANALSNFHCWRAFSLAERKASQPEEIFFANGMSRSHSLALRSLWFHHRLWPGRKLYSRLLRANLLRSE